VTQANLSHLHKLRRTTASRDEVRLHKIFASHFALAVPPPDRRIVGPAVGFGGKLILTVSLRLRLLESSSPEPASTVGPCGGLGGGLLPAGFVSGCRSLSSITLTGKTADLRAGPVTQANLFHFDKPRCASGGGSGERVPWHCAVNAVNLRSRKRRTSLDRETLTRTNPTTEMNTPISPGVSKENTALMKAVAKPK
jgi:hypothetical protein